MRHDRQQQKLTDDAQLVRAWSKWHRERLDEARAGIHGALVAELMNILDQLELSSAATLLAFVERTDWTVVDYETRLELLHQINDAICRLRERHGLPGIDDPIPPKNESVFRRVKARLLDSRTSGGALPEA